MTVQAGTEYSLELIVGDMPEVPCEVNSSHDHAATHYFQGKCPCGYQNKLKAICTPWKDRLVNGELGCHECGRRGAPIFLILEPITH